jgi:hypothetical protein
MPKWQFLALAIAAALVVSYFAVRGKIPVVNVNTMPKAA